MRGSRTFPGEIPTNRKWLASSLQREDSIALPPVVRRAESLKPTGGDRGDACHDLPPQISKEEGTITSISKPASEGYGEEGDAASDVQKPKEKATPASSSADILLSSSARSRSTMGSESGVDESLGSSSILGPKSATVSTGLGPPEESIGETQPLVVEAAPEEGDIQSEDCARRDSQGQPSEYKAIEPAVAQARTTSARDGGVIEGNGEDVMSVRSEPLLQKQSREAPSMSSADEAMVIKATQDPTHASTIEDEMEDKCEKFNHRCGVVKKGDIVEVDARTWPGINKHGGVARVRKVHEGESGASYDVAYLLGGTEKMLERKYLHRVAFRNEIRQRRSRTFFHDEFAAEYIPKAREADYILCEDGTPSGSSRVSSASTSLKAGDKSRPAPDHEPDEYDMPLSSLFSLKKSTKSVENLNTSKTSRRKRARPNPADDGVAGVAKSISEEIVRDNPSTYGRQSLEPEETLSISESDPESMDDNYEIPKTLNSPSITSSRSSITQGSDVSDGEASPKEVNETSASESSSREWELSDADAEFIQPEDDAMALPKDVQHVLARIRGFTKPELLRTLKEQQRELREKQQKITEERNQLTVEWDSISSQQDRERVYRKLQKLVNYHLNELVRGGIDVIQFIVRQLESRFHWQDERFEILHDADALKVTEDGQWLTGKLREWKIKMRMTRKLSTWQDLDEDAASDNSQSSSEDSVTEEIGTTTLSEVDSLPRPVPHQDPTISRGREARSRAGDRERYGSTRARRKSPISTNTAKATHTASARAPKLQREKRRERGKKRERNFFGAWKETQRAERKRQRRFGDTEQPTRLRRYGQEPGRSHKDNSQREAHQGDEVEDNVSMEDRDHSVRDVWNGGVEQPEAPAAAPPRSRGRSESIFFLNGLGRPLGVQAEKLPTSSPLSVAPSSSCIGRDGELQGDVSSLKNESFRLFNSVRLEMAKAWSKSENGEYSYHPGTASIELQMVTAQLKDANHSLSGESVQEFLGYLMVEWAATVSYLPLGARLRSLWTDCRCRCRSMSRKDNFKELVSLYLAVLKLAIDFCLFVWQNLAAAHHHGLPELSASILSSLITLLALGLEFDEATVVNKTIILSRQFLGIPSHEAGWSRFSQAIADLDQNLQCLWEEAADRPGWYFFGSSSCQYCHQLVLLRTDVPIGQASTPGAHLSAEVLWHLVLLTLDSGEKGAEAEKWRVVNRILHLSPYTKVIQEPPAGGCEKENNDVLPTGRFFYNILLQRLLFCCTYIDTIESGLVLGVWAYYHAHSQLLESESDVKGLQHQVGRPCEVDALVPTKERSAQDVRKRNAPASCACFSSTPTFFTSQEKSQCSCSQPILCACRLPAFLLLPLGDQRAAASQPIEASLSGHFRFKQRDPVEVLSLMALHTLRSVRKPVQRNKLTAKFLELLPDGYMATPSTLAAQQLGALSSVVLKGSNLDPPVWSDRQLENAISLVLTLATAAVDSLAMDVGSKSCPKAVQISRSLGSYLRTLLKLSISAADGALPLTVKVTTPPPVTIQAICVLAGLTLGAGGPIEEHLSLLSTYLHASKDTNSFVTSLDSSASRSVFVEKLVLSGLLRLMLRIKRDLYQKSDAAALSSACSSYLSFLPIVTKGIAAAFTAAAGGRSPQGTLRIAFTIVATFLSEEQRVVYPPLFRFANHQFQEVQALPRVGSALAEPSGGNSLSFRHKVPSADEYGCDDDFLEALGAYDLEAEMAAHMTRANTGSARGANEERLQQLSKDVSVALDKGLKLPLQKLLASFYEPWGSGGQTTPELPSELTSYALQEELVLFTLAQIVTANCQASPSQGSAWRQALEQYGLGPTAMWSSFQRTSVGKLLPARLFVLFVALGDESMYQQVFGQSIISRRSLREIVQGPGHTGLAYALRLWVHAGFDVETELLVRLTESTFFHNLSSMLSTGIQGCPALSCEGLGPLDGVLSMLQGFLLSEIARAWAEASKTKNRQLLNSFRTNLFDKKMGLFANVSRRMNSKVVSLSRLIEHSLSRLVACVVEHVRLQDKGGARGLQISFKKRLVNESMIEAAISANVLKTGTSYILLGKYISAIGIFIGNCLRTLGQIGHLLGPECFFPELLRAFCPLAFPATGQSTRREPSRPTAATVAYSLEGGRLSSQNEGILSTEQLILNQLREYVGICLYGDLVRYLAQTAEYFQVYGAGWRTSAVHGLLMNLLVREGALSLMSYKFHGIRQYSSAAFRASQLPVDKGTILLSSLACGLLCSRACECVLDIMQRLRTWRSEVDIDLDAIVGFCSNSASSVLYGMEDLLHQEALRKLREFILLRGVPAVLKSSETEETLLSSLRLMNVLVSHRPDVLSSRETLYPLTVFVLSPAGLPSPSAADRLSTNVTQACTLTRSAIVVELCKLSLSLSELFGGVSTTESPVEEEYFETLLTLLSLKLSLFCEHLAAAYHGRQDSLAQDDGGIVTRRSEVFLHSLTVLACKSSDKGRTSELISNALACLEKSPTPLIVSSFRMQSYVQEHKVTISVITQCAAQLQGHSEALRVVCSSFLDPSLTSARAALAGERL